MIPKYQLWREGRVVLAVVSGSWDRITAEDYVEDFKNLAAELADAPWAHLVYLEQWQLGVPEIEPVVQQLVQWCSQHQLQFVAQVYCPHMVKRYQLDRMIVQTDEVFQKRVYPTQSEAFDWLASVGFATTSQQLVPPTSR